MRERGVRLVTSQDAVILLSKTQTHGVISQSPVSVIFIQSTFS